MFQVSRFKFHDAQAVLALVFIIGGIIVLTGLTLAFVATSFVESTYGFKIAQKAQFVAASGAYDALMMLNRTKGFADSNCPSSRCSLDVGGETATVSFAQDSPSAGFVTITSSSTVSRRTRSVRVVASRNATSGLVSVVLWE